MNKLKCGCADPGCPACHAHCNHDADCIAFRIDMTDILGTPMCDDCADDALKSGVFRTRAIKRPATSAQGAGQ